jgi:ribulose-5-phosphate 4-epimerase/fuculose-1-phosphate aldolase
VAKHGAFVIGTDSTAVLERVIALEEVARLNYDALLLSHSVTPLGKKDAKLLHDFYESKYGQR